MLKNIGLIKAAFCALLMACMGLSSCSDKDGPDVKNVKMADVKIKRLEKRMFQLQSKAQVKEFLDSEPVFASKYLDRWRAPHDSMVINNVFALATEPALDSLYADCQAEFEDLSWLENELTEAFLHVKYYYPDFVAPQVCTVISGFGGDLFVSDSLIAIGLEYFLDDKSRWKPQDVPMYMMKRLRKQYIVPSIMVLISNNFNKQENVDKSMLAEMMFYGKAYEFAQKMIPGVHDTLVFGFTEQQRIDCEQNSDIIWAHFVEHDLFYETSRFVNEKYIGERPAVLEIGNQCPGRVGRWLGWQILRAYQNKHPEATLQQLMAMKSAKELFENSKYKPENR